jgi:hypothetical protein
MRLILELEETDDLQYLERVIALLKPYLPEIQYPEKLRKIKEFLDFSEHEGISVEKLNIPERELRNAR